MNQAPGRRVQIRTEFAAGLAGAAASLPMKALAEVGEVGREAQRASASDFAVDGRAMTDEVARYDEPALWLLDDTPSTTAVQS